MPEFLQASFSRGEIAPELYGRVDTEQYQVALRKARNIFIRNYGGAENRPGTIFCGPIKNHSQGARFIPFRFNDTDTYMLEFGDLYMRPIRNDAHVLQTAVVITGITAANPGVVTAAAHGFSNGDDVYITGVVGMTEVNGRFFRVANVAANTFELTAQETGTNVNTSAFTAYSSAGTVARLYTITTPYAFADLDELKYVQSADHITLTHRSYAVRELVRSGHASWTLSQHDFEPGQDHPTGLTATPDAAAGATFRYSVTALAEQTLEESLSALNNTTRTITAITQANPAVVTSAGHSFTNGDEVEINSVVGMTEVNGRRYKVANQAANTFELKDVDSTGYTAYSSGGSANQTFVRMVNSAATPANTIAWTAAAGAARYSVYREKNGLFGWIGDTELATFKDDNITPDLTITPPAQRNPFLEADDFPGAAGYYEQRRVMGGSNNKPATSEFSVVGAEDNFSISTPAEASDAFSVTLTSDEVNVIRHYVPLDDLIILTAGGEWRVTSGSETGFEATTVRLKPQTSWGCGHQRPIEIDGSILFVQDTEVTVRAIGYDLQADGFIGKGDLALFVPHFFRTKTIERWAFSRSPIPMIFIVRSDGWLACLTFDETQSVLGWSLCSTDGWFEDVATLRPSSAYVDEFPYFIVKRIINGNTVRYIERLHDRRFEDVRDCFFVDCGLSLDSPVTITGATAANPVVITAVAHGFSNGDEVDISDIVWGADVDAYDGESQPDQLNGYRYTVANAAANTFELTGADGSAFNAYVSGGTVRKAVLTVSGMHHLAGEEVVILADGNVVEGKTVSATGTVTLDTKASRIHIGLKYTSEIQTLDFEVGRGVTQGRKKMVPNIIVRMERSRGLFLGTDPAKLIEMKQREFESMGEPTELLTGDKKIVLNGGWGRNVHLTARQRYPLPMSLLFVKYDYDIEE